MPVSLGREASEQGHAVWAVSCWQLTAFCLAQRRMKGS